MLIPILNSLFVALNVEYYTRWFFMPTLIICSTSVKTLEDKELSFKKGNIAYVVLWRLFFLIYLWFRLYFKVAFFYNLVIVTISLVISIGGFILTLFVRHIQKKRYAYTLMTVGVIVFSITCGAYNIYLMHKCWGSHPEAPSILYAVDENFYLPTEDQYFRIDSDGYHFYNIGTMVNLPSIDSFSSTIQPSIFELYDLLGEPRSVISDFPSEKYGYRAFLSTKYWLRYGETSEVKQNLGYISHSTQAGFHVFENEWTFHSDTVMMHI